MKFTKMHGLGNDFIVIDATQIPLTLSASHIQQWSDRHRGIGFDQCLILEPPRSPHTDFFYRIYNANGQEVGQCGNGARCLARFIAYYNLSNKKDWIVETHTRTLQLRLNANDTVTVDLGVPLSAPKAIPLLMETQQASYHLAPFPPFHAINVGNPHAIVLTENVSNAPVQSLGQALSTHSIFPEGVNVGFMQRIDPTHIQLRVYERGCGETEACGSGAVAAAAVGRLYHGLEENIRVTLPGGVLSVQWKSPEDPIYLTGEATFVYEGEILL